MYTIFYVCIGGFGWAIIAIFMTIALVDPQKPKYYYDDGPMYYSSLIPGMGIRPHFGNSDPVIQYSIKNPDDYIRFLDLFLSGKILFFLFLNLILKIRRQNLYMRVTKG